MIRRITAVLLGAYALVVAIRSIGRGRRAARSPRWPQSRLPERWPFASLIIPAWRDRPALENCLRTVRSLDYPAYEVIVVAGGDDGTYEAAVKAAAESQNVFAVEQLPRGKNAALNQGLAEARGDVLVLLDADSEVESGWLQAMVAGLDEGVSVTTGNYYPLRQTPIALLGDVAKVAEYEVRGRVILQGSGGIALRRDTLDTLGPFPEERVSSDWDLDARVGLCGYRKAFVPGAVIRTHRPASLPQWWQNELRWRRLHLLSLFRLRSGLLKDPSHVARHVYPYALSWTIFFSAVGGLLGLLFRSRAGWTLATVSLALGSVGLFRDLGSLLEVFAYRPERRLLPAFVAAPALTVLGWAACLVSTASARRVKLQFKGARQ
jgi:cellulose synthase/poly-beta-1,6-N-acetylglucosamine synthase-like glycosyltransferase